MKGIVIQCVAALAGAACLAQQPQNSFASLTSGTERLSVVRSSIEVPVWHEKSFWTLYEKYVAEESETSSSAYRAIYNLATLDRLNGDEEAYEFGARMLGLRFDDLTLRKRYYAEIGTAFNGVIALQFLQTETLMDMMECFRIYENTRWKNYRFNAASLPDSKTFQAKINMLTAALSLSGQELINFQAAYSRYERECSDLLGDRYDIFALYAGEPSDFTPALAKRLGYDLLQISERELKLKEKYFFELNKLVGPRLAAGFLAWEDYHSLVSKMHAWADAP